jgi:hypothetical protein
MAGKKLTTAKNYNATYIYGLYNYGDIIYKAINEGERIDVKSDKFENRGSTPLSAAILVTFLYRF